MQPDGAGSEKGHMMPPLAEIDGVNAAGTGDGLNIGHWGNPAESVCLADVCRTRRFPAKILDRRVWLWDSRGTRRGRVDAL